MCFKIIKPNTLYEVTPTKPSLAHYLCVNDGNLRSITLVSRDIPTYKHKHITHSSP